MVHDLWKVMIQMYECATTSIVMSIAGSILQLHYCVFIYMKISLKDTNYVGMGNCFDKVLIVISTKNIFLEIMFTMFVAVSNLQLHYCLYT